MAKVNSKNKLPVAKPILPKPSERDIKIEQLKDQVKILSKTIKQL